MTAMVSGSDLHKTIRRQLDSETFEPDELRDLLVQRGHDEVEVTAAIAEVVEELETYANSPHQQQRVIRRRRAARLRRFGVMFLAVGLVYSLLSGAGILQLLVVVAGGGALVAAGMRGLKQ